MPDPKDMKALSPQDAAMEKLIRDTVHALGEVDAADLPHLLRQRIQGQIAGDIDVEAYLKRVKAPPYTPKEG